MRTRRIKILRTWSDGAGSRPIIAPPKTGQKRTIAVPKFLIKELGELTAGRNADEWLFTASGGKAVNIRNWRNRVWYPALEELMWRGSGLTVHKLRHTAASLAIAAGADVKVVQTMLGHANAMETLNTYSHLFPDRLDEIVDILENERAETVCKNS